MLATARESGGSRFPNSNCARQCLAFDKQFLSERFRQVASTSENQQVAVSTASGFLERLSGMASPCAGKRETKNRYLVAKTRKPWSRGQCMVMESVIETKASSILQFLHGLRGDFATVSLALRGHRFVKNRTTAITINASTTNSRIVFNVVVMGVLRPLVVASAKPKRTLRKH